MERRTTVEGISRVLREQSLRRLEQGFEGDAAVLMSILHRERPWKFLLTKRTWTVRTHKGQISFPGGFAEPGEDLSRTALRETEEELGIPPSSIRLLGPFHDYLSITGARVRPFVGLVRPGPLTPNRAEVDAILEVPVSFFVEVRPRVERHERHGKSVNIYHWDFDGEVIWGLTARMIRDLVVSWFNPDWDLAVSK